MGGRSMVRKVPERSRVMGMVCGCQETGSGSE